MGATATLTLVLALAGAASAGRDEPACAPAESVPTPLRLEATVRDPVFAALLALFAEDRYGCVSGDALASEVRRLGLASRLPYGRLHRIVRQRGENGASARTRIELTGQRFEIPIPYKILWIYRPGEIWVDTTIELTERRLGTLQISASPSESVRIESGGVFRLSQGGAGADIDAWIDRLFGARLDDMTVHGLGVFVADGHWWGLAIGANPKGQSRMGLFDFSSDSIVFPTPLRMWAVARRMRASLKEMNGAAGDPRAGQAPAD